MTISARCTVVPRLRFEGRQFRSVRRCDEAVWLGRTRLPFEHVETCGQRLDFDVLCLHRGYLAPHRSDLFILLIELAGELLNLIEQHRRQHMIGDRCDLAGGIVNHQFRVDPLDFLGDQPILLCACLVGLVDEGYRPQLHQLIAGVAHISDVALVTRRRRNAPELTGACDHYCAASGHRGVEDACDVSASLGALRADPDGVRIGRDALIADFYVVAARRQIKTSFNAYSDIAAARGVVLERVGADGRAGGAGRGHRGS